MYQEHFGFTQEPFSIAPDPRFLYLSEVHNEALAHLLYGFSHGGFVLITGEVGTGKTTLLRNLLDRTPPDLDVAFILNPRLTVRELLESLCDELGVDYPHGESLTVKQYIDALNKHLLATHLAGRSTVVIIDEAQNLSPAVLEQVRLLTNLETNEKKLLRIILLGQPELADMLERTELRQLAQRITARYHLKELGKADVAAYVGHRLTRAGGNPGIFSDSAISALYRLSKGTPRLINVIADRALLGAYVTNKYQVDPVMVRNAAKEVFGAARPRRWPIYAAGGVLAAGLVAVLAWAFLPTFGPSRSLSGDEEAVSSSRPRTTPSTRASQPIDTSPTQAQSSQSSAPEQSPTQSPITQPQASSQEQAETQISTSTPPTIASTEADDDFTAPTSDGPPNLIRPPGSPFATHRQAYRAVFGEWGSDYPLQSSTIPCDFAPTAGLQCLSRNGGWSEVNSLNSPIVLELWDDEESPYYGALLAKKGDSYKIQIAERHVWATPHDLRDTWFGAYVVLWQTPPSYMGSMRQGDRHPTVHWLHSNLSLLHPDELTVEADDEFDPKLTEAVIAFQSREGLVADGIVGPLTWIRLSNRLNLPAPRLSN